VSSTDKTIRVGDSVVARNGERGLRWRVTSVNPPGLDGFVIAERRKKGHVPITAIYRAETWRKR
jgi:hypothetical protein